MKIDKTENPQKHQFEIVGNGLLVRAPGKINLSLLIKGKRPDGYHELETIMAKIGLYDEILIEQKKGDRTQRSESKGLKNVRCSISNDKYRSETDIELICKGPYEVPEGKDNLVYKAAKLILDYELRISDFRRGKRAKKKHGIRITLTKNMPAGSGLGSGSSDAAGTLMGINRFLNLGYTKKELAKLAGQLGSDVAFFLGEPVSFCTGRGEKVKKLPKCKFRAFLIIPDVSVSTKRVYENYRHNPAEFQTLHWEINDYIKKKKIDLVGQLCANMLQESCFELNRKLRKLKKGIEGTGIGPICLSGSGSSMYCIIDKGNEGKITTYQNKLAQEFGCKSMILNSNSW